MKKIFAALFLLAVSTGLYAQEAPAQVGTTKFTPYILLRMDLGAWHRSKDYKDNAMTTPAVRANDDTDFWEKVLATSRAGLDTEDGNLKGKVEFGLSDPTTVTLRHLYFTYNFGFGEVMVGQNWTPYTFFSTEKCDDDSAFIGFGSTYDARTPQFKISAAGFYFDVMKPTVKALTKSANGVLVSDSYLDADMPKMALGYEYKDDMTEVGLGVAGNSYKIDKSGEYTLSSSATATEQTDAAAAAANASTLDGKRINSGLAYAHAKIKVQNLWFKINMGATLNSSNFGMNQGLLITDGIQLAESKDKFENTKGGEGFVEAGYNFGIFEILGGYGYCVMKNKMFDKNDAQQAYFAQVKVPVRKNFTISPEFAYHDFMKDAKGNKQGSEWFAGACVEVKF